MSQLLVRQALENPGRRIVILRKFATSIRLSVWDRVKSAIEEALPLSMCDINISNRRIGLPTGSEFQFVGADDTEKLKSIEDVGTYWLEEATEFVEQELNVLDAGMSTQCTPPPQFWLTFNPVPQIGAHQHWLQERFTGKIEHEMSVPRVSGNVCVLRTWYKDNAMCPQINIDILEGYKEHNELLYLMWALGEFTHLEGSILSNYNVVESVPARAHSLGYAIDFGYSVDPAAVVAVWQHGREIWIEQKVYMAGLTNPDLSEAMEEAGIPKYAHIVADSAEPKSIEELRREGWTVEPAIKFGQQFKKSAALFLQGLQIHILENSHDLQRECATWSWKIDKENHVLPIVEDGNDHGIDALIYRIYRPGGSIDFTAIEQGRGTLPVMRRSIVSDRVPALVG